MAVALQLRTVRMPDGTTAYQRVRGAMGDVDSATADRVAKAALLAQPANYAIAYVDRSGQVTIEQHPTRSSMTNKWDAMVDGDTIPSNVQEIVWLDRSQPDGEGWNMAVNPMVSSSVFSRINWKSAAPYVLGAGALIALAVYFSKPKKGTARRRRAASFRRRTVTVWR